MKIPESQDDSRYLASKEKAKRRAKLQKLQIQSEIEKRDAEDHLVNVRDREIGRRDIQDRQYEAKKSQMLAEANQMRHAPPNDQMQTQLVQKREHLRVNNKQNQNFKSASDEKQATNILDINFRNSPNEDPQIKAQPVQPLQNEQMCNSDFKHKNKRKIKRNQLHNQHNTVMSQDRSLNNSHQFMTSNASNIQNSQRMGNQIPRSAIINSPQSKNLSQNQFTTSAMGESSSMSHQSLMPNQIHRGPSNLNPMMSPNPKTGKGSGSKSRKRRPKRPKNKFMQPMQSSNMGSQMSHNMTKQTHLPSHAMKMPPPEIPAQAQLQALHKPNIQNMPPSAHLNYPQQHNQHNQNQILNLPIHKEFHEPPKLPSQIPSQSPPPPQTPPEMSMNKSHSRIDDDPFKGIGFSNRGMSQSDNTFPEFDVDKNISLFQPNNEIMTTSQNNMSRKEVILPTNSNNFDDPFSELIFDNRPKEENKMLAIEAPQAVDIPSLKLDQVTPQHDEQFNFGGQPQYKNGPQSTQYDFSDDEGAKNDDFVFDEININLDDLNLNDSPMPKVNHPTHTKRKHSVSSGMPVDSSRSSDSSSNISSLPNNPNLQNFNMNNRNMPIKEISDRNMLMNNMNNQNMPMRNMNNQNMPMRNMHNQNIPMRNMHDQNMPMRNMHDQNMPMMNKNMQMENMNNHNMPDHNMNMPFNKQNIERNDMNNQRSPRK